MKKGNNINKKYGLCFAILLVLLFVSVISSISVGSTNISFKEVWNALCGNKDNIVVYRIIWDVRMPRICAAIFLGGALTVSGYLLQIFFSNPIAGPFVLGISSGAKLTVALAMICFISNGVQMSSGMLVLSAFIGSMVSMGFVLLVSGKVKNMAMLVVCGVMIGYICSAICDFIVAFAEDSNIVNLHNWSLGSFAGMLWSHVSCMAVVITLAIICVFLLSKPMHAYQLGEEYAKNLGVNIKRFRLAIILLSGILSACVTAFAGPISFVGIAVPHLIRVMFKTSKPMVLVPGCFLGGACFCLICDMIARTVFAPIELSISSVTAIFGAPIVIIMLVKRKSNHTRG
ncbi:MAG: iron ABC transporter permease [Eubacteriales bacterium]|nr:iron ABC transporter permease [Eubacteriales bacterium]